MTYFSIDLISHANSPQQEYIMVKKEETHLVNLAKARLSDLLLQIFAPLYRRETNKETNNITIKMYMQ